MSANWNYAELTKTAAEMGGPEKYVEFIKAGAFARGMSRGAAIGSLVGAGVMGAVAVGVDRYRRIQARAAAAEIALLKGAEGEAV